MLKDVASQLEASLASQASQSAPDTSPIEAGQQTPSVAETTSPPSSQATEASQPTPETSQSSAVAASQPQQKVQSPARTEDVSRSSISQCTQTSPKPKKRRVSLVSPWTPLTKEELLSFIAVLIIMGYDEQPEMSNYWSTSSDLGNHAIRTAMTRVRFSQIWNNFRLSDEPSFTGVDPNTASPGTLKAMGEQKAKEDSDAIMKLRPMMEAINAKFRQCRNPSSHICIDESMTAYKGRTKIKMYQPKKPIKYGFEHFTLCDCADGYILNDEAHIGKKNHMAADPAQDPAKDLRSSHKMAHTTIYTARHYLNRGYTVVCDNRFTSALLFETFYKRFGTLACGSLRSNSSGMPGEWKRELQTYGRQDGRRRGDYTMRQSGRLLLTVWYDTKTVSLLSTNVDPVKASSGAVKRVISGQKRQVPCPAAALTYTESMNGVDIANHLVSSFYVGRRCRVWHRYLFFQKLNQILVNARINMMTACGSKKVHRRSQLSFRRNLVAQLLALTPKVRPVRLPAIQGTVHVQERAAMSRRCQVCRRYRDQRHETVWCCRTCRTHVCHDNTSRRLFTGRTCWQLHLDRVDLE